MCIPNEIFEIRLFTIKKIVRKNMNLVSSETGESRHQFNECVDPQIVSYHAMKFVTLPVK